MRERDTAGREFLAPAQSASAHSRLREHRLMDVARLLVFVLFEYQEFRCTHRFVARPPPSCEVQNEVRLARIRRD